MRLSKEITGKPLISIDEGRHLGDIKDLYLDTELNLITGIFVGKEGLLKRKERLILRDDVRVFGADAVLVRNSNVVTDDKEHPEREGWIRLGDLRGREVVTPGGTRVGLVGDVLLDDHAKVMAIGLSRVFVEGPIAENKGIMRQAVIQTGDSELPMIVDLALAESSSPNDPPPAKLVGSDDE